MLTSRTPRCSLRAESGPDGCAGRLLRTLLYSLGSRELTGWNSRADAHQPLSAGTACLGTGSAHVILFSLPDGLSTPKFLPVVPRRRGPDAAPARPCRTRHRGCPEGSCRCTPPCCPTDLHTRVHTHTHREKHQLAGLRQHLKQALSLLLAFSLGFKQDKLVPDVAKPYRDSLQATGLREPI